MIKSRFALALSLCATLAALAQPVRAEGGYALGFDGASDYVTLAPAASIIGPSWQTTKSVTLWVRPTGTPVCTGPEPGACDAIFGDKPRTWGISRGVLGGVDRIWVWNYDGTFDKVGIEYTPGDWVQIAVVHGGGMLAAYKNGVPAGTVASGATPALGGPSVLHIGGIIGNATRNWTFQGEIDEVALWSTARTDAQILESTFGPLAGNESGLAAYYAMSDGSGAMLTDDSLQSWSGTLVDGGSGVPADGPIQWIAPGVFDGGTTTNTRPVADEQSVTIDEDTSRSLTLTGSDADGDPLAFRVTTMPANGSVSGADSSVTYAPAANFTGTDWFEFVVNDGRLDSLPARVSIAVAPVQDAPIANDDTATTVAGTQVVVNAVGNDVDVDGDTLTIIALDDPAGGAVSHDGRQVTYVPDDGFAGVDVFTYTMTDGHGGMSSAAITVNVMPPSEGPGFALRFDGVSDYVSVAETAYVLGPGWETTKSVDLWMKPTGTPFCNAPGPGSCDNVFGDRPRWWGISRGVIGGLDRIWVWNWDGNLDTIPIPYIPGEWMHIALVHGGGSLSAYKNGVLIGSVPSGVTQQPYTGALPILTIGGLINTATRNWTMEGEIDEVRIWNVARSNAEIVADLTGPLDGSEYGLAAYYRMSDGAGLTVTDDSGHAWTGKIQDGGSGVPADAPAEWVLSGAFTLPD